MGVKATHPKYTCTNCKHGKPETDICTDCRVIDVDTMKPKRWEPKEGEQT